MKQIKSITLLTLLALFFSCNNNKKAVPEKPVEIEELKIIEADEEAIEVRVIEEAAVDSEVSVEAEMVEVVEELKTIEAFFEKSSDKSVVDDAIEYKNITGATSWTWEGVKNCCDKQDLKVKIEAKATIWAKAEVKKYPGYGLYSWGAKPATANCRYGERTLQGRWCNGSISVSFYAKLYKF